MIPFKEKSNQILRKITSKLCSKQYIRHILLVILITLILGLLFSLPIARRTTVNDTTIKYTEPPTEEMDTEGYNGEEQPEEVPADVDVSSPEEAPAEETSPSPEEAPVEEAPAEPENPAEE